MVNVGRSTRYDGEDLGGFIAVPDQDELGKRPGQSTRDLHFRNVEAVGSNPITSPRGR
jgi:hypothetical protein